MFCFSLTSSKPALLPDGCVGIGTTMVPNLPIVLIYAWCLSASMNSFYFHSPKSPGLDDQLHGHPNHKGPQKLIRILAHQFLCI